MLTTSEIAAHLEQVSYRPGWTFHVYDGRWEGQHLSIRATVENAYRPGLYLPLRIETAIPPIPDIDYLEQWLAWRLGRVEVHEMLEWLRRDGRPIIDPHRDGADRDL